MTITLSAATLSELPEGVARPGYDRAALTPGIVHFGVGNFHRAHQAVYLDALIEAGEGEGWGLVGAGVLPSDARMRETLAAQNYLTTVVRQWAEGADARVIGPMVDFLPVGDAAAIIAQLSDPAIRIVSLTVTEGGWCIDPATGAFDPAHPLIEADAARPDAPESVFGLIAAGLRARRAAGTAPFTVMSCDNLPHNGKVARAAVAGMARRWDADLADWIEAGVSFPNGMVDRITPATGDRERAALRDQFGIADASPVFCEDFIQWVLEDDFPAGRPALEKVGVQFVPDVTPYENMKIRVLNGGHAIIAYPAGLLGIEFAHEAMAHPLIDAFLTKVEEEEVLPSFDAPEGEDKNAYLQLIRRRFANPKIADQVRRLCLDGSNRQPKFIIPTVADRLAAGGPVAGLALESALWRRYCLGVDEAGAAIAPNDPSWDRLTAAAARAEDDPMEWLAMEDIYGATGRDDRFRAAFAAAHAALKAEGVEATLRRYLSGGLSGGA
ncbi:mannitol dehydrogenase family protein [Rhodovulum sp. DZ06]|uniref:mannitol dehydrogenase family protein n=1 Tax=Rhodovulum sp. DZ06 TaxID=3425126 RepID=UPI003D34B361